MLQALSMAQPYHYTPTYHGTAPHHATPNTNPPSRHSLFRLVAKLSAVTNRQDGADVDWRTSADRELLSLFQQTVFHPVDAEGLPVVDLAHMVSHLNKLDVGHGSSNPNPNPNPNP